MANSLHPDQRTPALRYIIRLAATQATKAAENACGDALEHRWRPGDVLLAQASAQHREHLQPSRHPLGVGLAVVIEVVKRSDE